MTPDVLERFEAKVVPEPNSGCWLWTGCVNAPGYGYLHVDGSMYRAHILSYKHYIGEVPEGNVVCHKCDVPSCVNPSHLFCGTRADNARDMCDKGRQSKISGETHGRARITDLEAWEISRKAHNGHSQREIASEYGVSQSWVSRIKNSERKRRKRKSGGV